MAQLLGGFSAGMAYPTTLALIMALLSGPGRTWSSALWSGPGGAIASLGPLPSGWLLEARLGQGGASGSAAWTPGSTSGSGFAARRGSGC